MIDQSVLGPGMIGGIKLWRRQYKEHVQSWGDKVLVVSYPKSGRTWHRVLLAHYINSTFLGQETRSLDTKKLTRKAGLPQISYTHAGANFLNAISPWHPFNGSAASWRGRRVILLTRDPKDVLVSAYMHACFRSKSFSGSLSEFVRHPFTGIEKLLVAHNRWASYMPYAREVLWQRYETIHDDPAQALRETLEFCDIGVDPLAVKASVDFGHIDNLKEKERSGFFESGAMRSEARDKNAMKVRDGKIGSHKQRMSAEDIDYIESAIARIGYPFQAQSAS
ncbi:sulfotransferase domain-containing protein [Aestuariivirga sp. YIM B02566]|uniref:Sulfotransferase domain-containing protein n=1 Tax=Taklimakanibacter albus TaxID=2800327 RepID=A0ACC5R3L4_9HYPH|nr:sulfotransferase domain-containing protein [Aestuariivirga sp. YIM B02566]MBK1867081.1 sulfotransferase domain-containing protein [Aestuariivirga sp. YIM B02566]